MSRFRIKGLIAPTFTPLKSDGSINYDLIHGYAAYLIEQRVPAVFINGSSGEFFSLSVNERKQVAERWLASSQGKLKCLIHVGCSNLPDTKELAEHAKSIGASGIAIVPPYYQPPTTVEAVISYLRAATETVPDLPLIYYHIPMFTRCPVDVVEIIRVGQQALPQFSAVKLTDGDLVKLENSVKAGGDAVQIICGMESSYLRALELGGEAAILGSATSIPGPLQRLASTWDKEEGAREHLRITQILQIISKYGGQGGLLGALKELTNTTGLTVGAPRLPLLPLTPEERSEMRGRLEKIGFFQWRNLS